MDTSKFDIVTTSLGVLSIRDNTTREIMHNPVGPWAEANSLYIDQSQLRRRLGENLAQELVIFDVGLGAAANALAVLHCAKAVVPHRPLRLVSFERDLELLEFALANANHFDHFKGFEFAIRTLLDRGKWEEPGITWELRHGDFTQLIVSEPFKANLVFYDPYSSKKNLEMWVTGVFRTVREKCSADGMLFTYSRATPIRVAMLVAGFFVGEGLATGEKEQTTQASVRLEDLARPLGASWLGRWQRSHHPNATGLAEEELPRVKEFILRHPQFRSEI